ncbi:cadherin domain-containing protein [Enterovirga sp. CN4-39]|uniref:cadherin domain-containing protein n=1 Tax=Enterovirga sp. CN4-39 TaxID=3400910 RepID=UPI003C05843A
MAIVFGRPRISYATEGGNPGINIGASESEWGPAAVTVEVIGGDVELWDVSGWDHILGRHAASQYFPTGIDYDRPVRPNNVYTLEVRATSFWYDVGGNPHSNTATQTFELHITDLPPPDISSLEQYPFRVDEGRGTGRVLSSELGASHRTPGEDAQNGGPVVYSLTDNDGGNFEVIETAPYVYTLRTAAGSSLQVGPDGTAPTRYITLAVTDGTSTREARIPIEVLNVLPTAPVDTDASGNGTQGIYTLSGSVVENAAAGTLVGITARATDPGDTAVSYAISDPETSPFTIDPQTGVVTVKAGARIDYEGGALTAVEVIASDGHPGSAQRTTFFLDVRDVNEAPVFASYLDGYTPEIAENSTAIIDYGPAVQDFDETNDTVSFSVTGGADGTLFAISAGGALTFKSAPDFDAPRDSGGDNLYEVEITATDNRGAASAKTVSIRVTDVNEAPTITHRTFTVASGATAIGTIGAVDPDAGDALRFSFVPGDYESQGKFLLDGLTGAIRFSSPRAYDANDHTITVPIVVTDAGGRSDTQTVTVEILPPPAPTDTTPPAFSSASISGPTLLLTYDGPIDADHLPGTSAFAVTIDGVSVGVGHVGYRPESPDTVVVVLNASAAAGQLVRVSYTDPTGANDAFAIQDVAGNDAASLVNAAVQNGQPNVPTPGPDVLTLGPSGPATLDALGGDDYVTITGGVHTVFGSAGNDTITAATSADQLWASGDSGDDALQGGAASDVLDGGLGRDFMDGGEAGDTYYADDTDTLSDSGTSGADTVIVTFAGGTDASNTYYLPESIENLILGGNVAIGAGTSSANYMQGNELVNALYGGDGADTLVGLGGQDWLQGDAGADFIYGGTEDDVIGGGADADWLLGEDGNDAIWGDAGNDVISGASGSDYIIGGTGYDLLYGGEGNDVFLVARVDQEDIIFGEAGADTVYFADRASAELSSIAQTGNGYTTISFTDGHFSSVTGIEWLQFADAGWAISS